MTHIRYHDGQIVAALERRAIQAGEAIETRRVLGAPLATPTATAATAATAEAGEQASAHAATSTASRRGSRRVSNAAAPFLRLCAERHTRAPHEGDLLRVR